MPMPMAASRRRCRSSTRFFLICRYRPARNPAVAQHEDDVRKREHDRLEHDVEDLEGDRQVREHHAQPAEMAAMDGKKESWYHDRIFAGPARTLSLSRSDRRFCRVGPTLEAHQPRLLLVRQPDRDRSEDGGHDDRGSRLSIVRVQSIDRGPSRAA